MIATRAVTTTGAGGAVHRGPLLQQKYYVEKVKLFFFHLFFCYLSITYFFHLFFFI